MFLSSSIAVRWAAASIPLAIPLTTDTPARTRVRVRLRAVRSPYPVELRVPTIATRGLVSAEVRPIAYNGSGGLERSSSSIG